MKCTSLALAAALWGAILLSDAAAQPILNRVEQFIRDQIDAGRPPAAAQPAQPAAEQGYMGLVADDSQEQGRGVRVVDLTPGGPAAAAGIDKGDVITAVGGQGVGVMADVARVVQGKPPGTRLTVTLLRGGNERQVDVTLGRRGQPAQGPVEEVPPGLPGAAPASVETLPPGPRLGIRTMPVSEDVQQQNNLPDANGALIVNVTPGSAAEKAGLAVGNVILAVDGKPIETPQQLAQAIRGAQTGEVELTYVAGGDATRKKIALDTGPAATAPPATLPRRLPASRRSWSCGGAPSPRRRPHCLRRPSRHRPTTPCPCLPNRPIAPGWKSAFASWKRACKSSKKAWPAT